MTVPDDHIDTNGITFDDDPYGLGLPLAAADGTAGTEIDPECLPEIDGMAEDAPEHEKHDDEDNGVKPVLNEIGSHLDELRKRLIISFAGFVPFFIIGLIFYQSLWDIIILPLNRASPHLSRFQALGPSDGLIMAMRIAFAFALFLSLPIWLGQLWSFIAPGLTAREKRWLYASLGFGVVLFVVGASLAYLVGVPLALEFLLPFNQSLSGWENSFTGHDYVDFVITCCLGFGLAFELPLVMMALGWCGIMTPELIKASWRPIILVMFVCAAIVTPPDPFTQLLMALPMAGLFVIGYYLVKWTRR